MLGAVPAAAPYRDRAVMPAGMLKRIQHCDRDRALDIGRPRIEQDDSLLDMAVFHLVMCAVNPNITY
jgi:hypothetical protein